MQNLQFQSELEKFDSNLWGHHFVVPAQMGDVLVDGDNRRVICQINDSEPFQCALMPHEGDYFILVNQKLRERWGLSLGDMLSIRLVKDTTEYGMPVTEEFRLAMDQDEEGKHYFMQLSPGKQRSLLYIAAKVKSQDSRIKKALAILHHLREMKGKLDFKILGKTIKDFNQRF
jgi:hypothetical protein